MASWMSREKNKCKNDPNNTRIVALSRELDIVGGSRNRTE
jgi:hypothetical protein